MHRFELEGAYSTFEAIAEYTVLDYVDSSLGFTPERFDLVPGSMVYLADIMLSINGRQGENGFTGVISVWQPTVIDVKLFRWYVKHAVERRPLSARSGGEHQKEWPPGNDCESEGWFGGQQFCAAPVRFVQGASGAVSTVEERRPLYVPC